MGVNRAYRVIACLTVKRRLHAIPADERLRSPWRTYNTQLTTI